MNDKMCIPRTNMNDEMSFFLMVIGNEKNLVSYERQDVYPADKYKRQDVVPPRFVTRERF